MNVKCDNCGKTFKEHYKKYGYECLIIWYDDLMSNPEHVMDMIKAF